MANRPASHAHPLSGKVICRRFPATTMGLQRDFVAQRSYCLMRNYFHLVVETPNANLALGMRWFLSANSIRLNQRRKLFGHAFSGRFKALLHPRSAEYMGECKKQIPIISVAASSAAAR